MTPLGNEDRLHWYLLNSDRQIFNTYTHHGELAIPKPHNPAGPICSSTPAAHPPGYNPARPPRETSQFPKHQCTDAKAPSILLARTENKTVLKSLMSFLTFLNVHMTSKCGKDWHFCAHTVSHTAAITAEKAVI